MYIHERPDWPQFQWNQEALSGPLAEIRHRQGRLLGRMESLGFTLQKEAELETLTLEVLKSSEIEGEKLDAAQVRSSIARRLGLETAGTVVAERDVEGVVDMMLDATQNYLTPLSDDRLFGWHASLFPTGRSGMRKIIVGSWRNDAHGPMQVVSGPVGREKVHYEAPAAALLKKEMSAFFAWANDTEDKTDLVIRAALAHLWFVTIHPFDDGNGRMARAIADWALARSEGTPQRFYSMSAQIRHERSDYYAILEKTQKGTLDVTPWMEWFLGCLGRAFEGTEVTLGTVLRKARFWEKYARVQVNDRQRDVINRLLDGFTGKLTTTKWAKLEKCSHDTALRDIQGLIELRLLQKEPGGGRSTSYSLVDDSSRDLHADPSSTSGEMADGAFNDASDEVYEITLTTIDKLSMREVQACIDVIADGDAVPRRAAEAGLPQAATLAVARHKDNIIGVGVIKGPNPRHARTVAEESSYEFPETTPELGYVAVRKSYRGKHLSSRMLEAIVAASVGPLYATTSDEKMKHLLDKHGFRKKGKTWLGRRRDVLSLWLKD